jgi:hypothetical protein
MVTGAPKKIRGGFLVFVTFEVILLVSSRIYPQVVGATLSGTVTDQSGAVIPNGQVSIKNVATGVTRDLTTDAAGFYTAPNLLPGAYEVTTSAPGFATEVRTGVTLMKSRTFPANFRTLSYLFTTGGCVSAGLT